MIEQIDKTHLEYSIVIPVYKSGPWMDELVLRIGAVMDSEAPGAFELILVNDCSPDTVTWPAIKRNAEKHSWVRGFDLLFNVGQFRAIMCGFYKARGRFVLTMDDDFQHIPEEIPKLIRAMREDNEVLCIIGGFEKKKHSLFRNIGSRLYQKILSSVYGKPEHIQATGFRIIRKELVDAILSCQTIKPQISALIISMTDKIKNVPVYHAARMQGRSGYNVATLVQTTIENIINASTVPLRLFSIAGLLSAGASMMLAVLFFLRWLAGGIGVAGFTTQILLIIFFGGMTLTGIGIIGEYVARIISEITGPERFRIKNDTEKGHE